MSDEQQPARKRRPPHVAYPTGRAAEMIDAGLDLEEIALDILAWAESSTHLLDGRLSMPRVRRLPGWTTRRQVRLAEAAHWTIEDRGIGLVGYLDFNSTREHVDAVRGTRRANAQRAGQMAARRQPRDTAGRWDTADPDPLTDSVSSPPRTPHSPHSTHEGPSKPPSKMHGPVAVAVAVEVTTNGRDSSTGRSKPRVLSNRDFEKSATTEPLPTDGAEPPAELPHSKKRDGLTGRGRPRFLDDVLRADTEARRLKTGPYAVELHDGLQESDFERMSYSKRRPVH